jgi:DNA-binding LytR/AlgR family response regulator
MIVLEDRILLHLQDGRRIPVDPQEIYLLEAEGGETLVRTRRAQQFASRIAVREIRPAPEGRWEVKLDPPINRVLPVSRRRISALWERFGE